MPGKRCESSLTAPASTPRPREKGLALAAHRPLAGAVPTQGWYNGVGKADGQGEPQLPPLRTVGLSYRKDTEGTAGEEDL